MASTWLAIATSEPPHCSSPQTGSALELLKQAGQLLVSIAFSQLFHSLFHLLEQVGLCVGEAKARAKKPLDDVGESMVVWIVLMHDYCSPKRRGTGGICILMAISGLGEGHQHSGSSADGEFTEASGTSAADGQVRMLQQSGDFIAEAALGQIGVRQLVDLGIVSSCEMHHPAALIKEVGQDRAHHAVEPNGSLTPAHHHQQWSVSLGDPFWEWSWCQKSGSNRCARDDGMASGNALGGRGQTNGDSAAQSTQHSRDATRDGI